MNFNSSVAAEGYGELILLANKIKKQKTERKKKNRCGIRRGGGLNFSHSRYFFLNVYGTALPPPTLFQSPTF